LLGQYPNYLFGDKSHGELTRGLNIPVTQAVIS